MPKHVKDKKDFERIGNILDNVLGTLRKDFDRDLLQIWDRWDQIVGEAIAESTRPAAFKGKLLLVHVTSSTWVHQLRFLKKDIIARINETFGKELVEEIKFKIGS
ncbi:DUF721 domain-containing protein [Thermodesulfobacteriota bacterium]